MKHLLYILLLGIMLASCTTTRYVPIESVRTEYKDRFTTLRDSIFVSDSVVIREKGDTIFVERTHTEYKDRYLHDTISVVVTDSVDRPVPVPAQLSRWQKLKIELGGIAMGLLVAVVAWLVYRRLRLRLR